MLYPLAAVNGSVSAAIVCCPRAMVVQQLMAMRVVFFEAFYSALLV